MTHIDRTDNFYVSVLIKNGRIISTQANIETKSLEEVKDHLDVLTKHTWQEQRMFEKQANFEYFDSEKPTSIQNIDELGMQLSAILGLDELEASIYLNLLRVGPISASALAKEIEVERTKTYRTIEKLINQNIVSTTFSKPKLCIATKPEHVLKMIMQRKEDELKKLKLTKEDVIKKIKETVPAKHKTSLPTFHVIQGRDNIYSNIGKLLEESTGIVYIVTSLKDISKMYHTSIPEKIKICEKNGGQVKLLTEITDKKLLSFVNRFGATEIKFGKLSSKGRIIVEQNKQMIMSDATLKENHSVESDFAFSTNSHEMVNNIFTLCSFLWQSSRTSKIHIEKK